jgi:riboflavin kinase/FMN adenylyltransferase
LKLHFDQAKGFIKRIQASELVLGKRLFEEPVVLTFGSFDGIHLGHQQILSSMSDASKMYEKSKKVLLTFYPHPSVALKKIESLPSITNISQRISYLSNQHIDHFVLVHFSKKVQQMEWKDFLKCLANLFNLKEVIIGEDARIGRAALGTAQGIKDHLELDTIKVTILPLLLEGNSKYGSRAIRDHIARGELKEASRELGRPFCIEGKVIRGNQIGRTLGFPTANINYKQSILPPCGVYAVTVTTKSGSFLGAANLGIRPTVNNSNKTILEIHLIDFSGDLYGQRVSVEFLEKIREEIAFNSLEELKKQIEKDLLIIRQRKVS